MARKSDKKSTRRRHPIPLYDERYAWWTAAVERQLDAIGINQKQLAKAIDESESDVSRCINRKRTTYELLIIISDYLKIAYPVVLPESEEQALEIAKAKRLYKRVAEASEIKAGVPETSKEDQTVPVVSEHAIRSRKAKAPEGRGSGSPKRAP